MTDILYTIDDITDTRNIPYVDNIIPHKQPIGDIINQLINDNNHKRDNAKLAKILAREDAKQVKIQAREDAKQAKIKARDDAKQVKIQAREHAKQVKIQAREDAKQVKIQAREDAKQAKIKARDDAKQAKIQAKEQAKHDKIQAREDAKQAKILAKQAMIAERARDKLLRIERRKRSCLIRRRYRKQTARTSVLFNRHREVERLRELQRQRQLQRQLQRQRQREQLQQQRLQQQQEQFIMLQQQQQQQQQIQPHTPPHTPPIADRPLPQPDRPRRSQRLQQQPLNTTNVRVPITPFDEINPDILSAIVETSIDAEDFGRRMDLLLNSGILQTAVNPNQEAINRDRAGATKTNILELVSNQHAFKQDECPICFDPIGETNQTILRCGHQLCTDCIFHNIQTIGGTKCPVCREQICVRVNGWVPPQRTY
jgi:hypothetical protein